MRYITAFRRLNITTGRRKIRGILSPSPLNLLGKAQSKPNSEDLLTGKPVLSPEPVSPIHYQLTISWTLLLSDERHRSSPASSWSRPIHGKRASRSLTLAQSGTGSADSEYGQPKKRGPPKGSTRKPKVAGAAPPQRRKQQQPQHQLPSPPLESKSKSLISMPLQSLRNLRAQYVSTLKEKMRAPDGTYANDISIPGERPSRSP